MDSQTARSAQNIREEERARLAQHLEARLGQSLNTLLAQANAYQGASAAHAQQALRTLAAIIARTLTDFRALTADLNPRDIADLGLIPALESLALRIEQHYGLTITRDMPALARPLPTHLPLAMYRIAQQALHNIGQHANAARVGLSIREEQDSIRLIIADDGHGFHPPEPLNSLTAENKHGLAEIGAWVTAVGGQMEINSVFGVGTQVRVLLPLTLPELELVKSSEVEENKVTSLIEALTPREQDVLVGVTEGLTNKQIAVRLGISDRTVQFHLGNVLGKLGVASRTEAAVMALQQGLVQK